MYSSPLLFYYIQYFICILRSNTAPSLVICYIPCQYSYPSYVHDLYPQVFLPSVHYAAVYIDKVPASFSYILFDTVPKNTEYVPADVLCFYIHCEDIEAFEVVIFHDLKL